MTDITIEAVLTGFDLRIKQADDLIERAKKDLDDAIKAKNAAIRAKNAYAIKAKLPIHVDFKKDNTPQVKTTEKAPVAIKGCPGCAQFDEAYRQITLDQINMGEDVEEYKRKYDEIMAEGTRLHSTYEEKCLKMKEMTVKIEQLAAEIKKLANEKPIILSTSPWGTPPS